MNELLEKLRGGDLRSDGRANDVVEEVLRTPSSLSKLIEGLDAPDKVVRGRTADALEKISRVKSGLLRGYMRLFTERALRDDVPMVRWHLVMILGSMARSEEEMDEVIPVLSHLLQDESAFVRSWSITGLCILGGRCTERRGEIAQNIEPLKGDKSIAVRVRAEKALQVLDGRSELPEGWYKDRGERI